MLFDLSPAILLLASGTYLVRRRARVKVNGIVENGTETTFSIKASAQPTPGAEAQNLPEGYRNRETWTLYTPSELHEAKPPGVEGDLVTINGGTFEVIQCQRWQDSGNYYRAVAVRLAE